MKLICVLLATTLIARAASSDPGKVAIDFLEKVRLGKLDLTPGADTALSAQTADEKKREIAIRLQRMGRELGSDPLELGAIKLDDNFAAVLIRKVGGFDPSRLQVFPVALVKNGTEWSAAPVPASFENAGAGYAIPLRKRLEILENWMLREQVIDLEKLRGEATERMRQKIQTRLTIDELQSFGATETEQRFLTACEHRDLPTVLGLLGGLSTNLPDDWPARLKAADAAIPAGSQAKHPWRLLTSPDVLRVVVNREEDENSGLFSIACLDPSTDDTRSSLPRIEVVHFDLSKSNDGLWRIDPPVTFLQDSALNEEETDEDSDADLLNGFPTRLRLTHPATPQPDARHIYQSFLASLKGENLPSLLQLTQLDDEPKAALKACELAAQIWWTFHDPATVRHAMPLGFEEDETSAAGLFQLFSPLDPQKSDFRTLYFEKSKSGWLWVPDPAPATREKFQVQITADAKRWSGEWREQLLSDSFDFKDIAEQSPPTKEDAQKVVEAWLNATRSGDVKGALQLTTRLNDPDGGAAVLRNLGHEIISTRRNRGATEPCGIYQGKIWTAVGLKIDQGGKPSFPLYPVIQTPQGPRILVEIDLFASRGREFLNKTALERLRKSGTPAASDDLRLLFDEFEKQVESLKKL
ncbi:MAG: hypothetical protein ABI600_01610 [Luteolibacter sp.]